MLLVVAMVGAIILVRPNETPRRRPPLAKEISLISIDDVLVVGALLFSIGLFVALSRRNAVGVLMGVELMLNSVNLNLVGFARFADVAAADRRPGLRRLRHHRRGGGSSGGAGPGRLRLPLPSVDRRRPTGPPQW